MKCPACHIDLEVSFRDGNEVGYCPVCDVNWIGQDEFEISIHPTEFADADWELDRLEAGVRNGTANRNGSV